VKTAHAAFTGDKTTGETQWPFMHSHGMSSLSIYCLGHSCAVKQQRPVVFNCLIMTHRRWYSVSARPVLLWRMNDVCTLERVVLLTDLNFADDTVHYSSQDMITKPRDQQW